MSLDDVTALVLAGGSSRRFGSDKLSALLHGTSVLDHLLTSLPPGLDRHRRGRPPGDRATGAVGP